jgi:hypothetical protein
MEKCAIRFKALKNTSAQKKFEDNGMVAAVCTCGVPLRFYNVSGTGERLAYAHRLIDEILADPSCPDSVFILYDVNCVFSKYLRTRMDGRDFQKLQFGIGIFHVYAHHYPCQIQFSPRGLVGLGWVDGEICERLWSWLMHFIVSNRSASAYTRIQVLTHASIEIGESRLLALSKVFCTSLINAFVLWMEANNELQKLAGDGLTESDIRLQYNRMQEYFARRQTGGAVDINDDIFTYIRAFRQAKEYLLNLVIHGTDSDKSLESSIPQLENGLFDRQSDISARTLSSKIHRLLEESNQSIHQWLTLEGQPGPLYIEYEKKFKISDARAIKSRMWEDCVMREFESARLRKRPGREHFKLF